MVKKYCLAGLFILTSLYAVSQKNTFIFNFVIKNLDQKYEIILEPSTKDTIQLNSLKITKKDSITFVATGVLDRPGEFKILVKNRKISRPFFLQKGESSLVVNFDSLYTNLKIENSRINDDYLYKYIPSFSGYKLLDNEWWRNYNLFKEKYKDDIPLQISDSLFTIRGNIDFMRDSLLVAFVKKYPKSIIGLWKIDNSLTFFGYAPSYLQAFKLLDKKTQSSIDGKAILAKLYTAKNLSPTSFFPLLSLLDTSNRVTGLGAKLTADYTLIDFWYSNCYPCLEQFRELKKIYPVYPLTSFQIIGISTDKIIDKEKWLKTIETHGLVWLNLWDREGNQAKKLYIESFPTNFLVDRSGKIIRRDIKKEELESFLKDKYKQ